MAAKGSKPRSTRGSGPTLLQQSRRVSPAEKAAFHNIDGAGRRHVRREFFGLNASDEEAIVDRLDQALAKKVKETR